MQDQFNYISQKLSSNSAEIYLHEHRPSSNIIYIVTLITIIAVIIALPFIYVDVSVSGVGSVRPVSERTSVTTSISEYVDSVYKKEGDRVKKGDIILTQRCIKNDNQLAYREDRKNDLNAQIHDLKILVTGKIPSPFSSTVIQEEYTHYISKLQQISTDLTQYKIEWERNKGLYDEGLISESEYNKYYYQYKDKCNELSVMKNNQASSWQNKLYNNNIDYKEVTTSGKELQIEKNFYEVRSPISGILEQFNGIYKGSSLSAGEQIAIISPDSHLCLEVYISPRDIAFIKKGMDVRIQIESLNYYEWGMLNGKVSQVSSDLISVNGEQYAYKVKCKIDKNYLTLKNTDHKAYIKKGMNASAHFIVTRQSLFTLIYKNIDEWINPTQYNHQ